VGLKEFEQALGRLGVRRASLALPEPAKDDGRGKIDADAGGKGNEGEGLSMWDLLRDEGGMEDWDGWIVDGKWERIANFLAVPLAVEKVLFTSRLRAPTQIQLCFILQGIESTTNSQVTLFGALLCLDGFLYNFTILPIRSIFATARIISNVFARHPIWPIPPTHLLSIIRMLLLFIPTAILLVATDASKMYHTVRGQDTIKLYVIFNALEVSTCVHSWKGWSGLMIDCR
jgi:hypothetical protein